MSSLTGKTKAQTYKQLLQVGSGNSGLSASFQTVQDGNGTNSALGLSTTNVYINGYAITGTNTGSIEGTNTGDQNLFSTIAVSGQSNVVPGTTSDTVTYVAGSGITITTNASTKSVTFSSSGKIAQQVHTEYTAVQSGSTTIPFDNTIPQNTEGNSFMSQAITPSNASSLLRIDIVAVLAQSSSTTDLTMAVIQDSTANSLAAWNTYYPSNTRAMTLKGTHWMTAGTTSSTTFTVRCGSASAGTVYLNATTGLSSGIFGGVCSSSITITEYLP